MKKRILIVEDEAMIAMDIQTRLVKLGFEVIGFVLKAKDVLAKVEKDKPDLVLMDIHLNGKEDGIKLAEEIINQKIPVVFLTAFKDTTTFSKAIESSPYGYVTKPFKDHDLRNAIEIAFQQFTILSAAKSTSQRYQRITEKISIEPSQVPGSVFIKDGTGIVQIQLDEILYVKAYDTYCKVITTSHLHLVNALLKELEQKLPVTKFQRIHRSYIISLDRVNKIEKEVVHIGTEQIPVSKSYRKTLMDRLDVI